MQIVIGVDPHKTTNVVAAIDEQGEVVGQESFPANRTDAEIIADQKKASEERRRAAEAKRKQFRDLEKRLGIE